VIATWKILLFWGGLNLVAPAIAGLAFKPLGSIDKWLEHSLFISQLLIGTGLFWFTSERYGLTFPGLIRDIFTERARSILSALKHLAVYLGLLFLASGLLILFFVIFDKFSAAPGGNSSILGPAKDLLKFKALASSAPGGMIFFLLGTCLLAPIIEETFYRRMLFADLKTRVGFIWSLLGTSLLFGLFHSSILISGAASAYLCYVYEKENNLSTNIVLHSLINCANILIMAILLKLR